MPTLEFRRRRMPGSPAAAAATAVAAWEPLPVEVGKSAIECVGGWWHSQPIDLLPEGVTLTVRPRPVAPA